MKSKLAYAIVSKKRPSIDVTEIYPVKELDFLRKHAVLDNEYIQKVVVLSIEEYKSLKK